MVKRIIPFITAFLLLVYTSGKSNQGVPYSNSLYMLPPDSTKLVRLPLRNAGELNPGEVFISPGLGYGSMTITGSPLDNSMFTEDYNYGYNYNSVSSPDFGCSVDYLATQIFSFGLGINYQTIKYTLVNPQTNYNSYYDPNSAQFNRLNIGMRGLFYFSNVNTESLQFYMGARAGLSFWKEIDTWTSAINYDYRPLISSQNDGILSFQLIMGSRYIISSDIGIQIELGLGSPYYGQVGVVFRLNDKPATYTVTKSEYRAMNEAPN